LEEKQGGERRLLANEFAEKLLLHFFAVSGPIKSIRAIKLLPFCSGLHLVGVLCLIQLSVYSFGFSNKVFRQYIFWPLIVTTNI
jgi:hypothetical protein